MSFLGTTRSWLLLAAIAGSVGCRDNGESTDERHYTVCGNDFGKADMVNFLDGNMVILAGHVEQGVGAGEIAGGLIFGLVLNGIDFSNLDYEPTFSDGRYEITNGDAALGFSLFFIDAFGEHEAGDIVPYNLFDPSSFVENFEVTSFDPVTGRVTYDYDEGPLYDLVDGDVDVDVDNLDVSVRVRIHVEQLAFEAFSEKTHHGHPPRNADALHVVMTTTRAPILDVYDQFLAGEYGFRYTGTTYDSVYYGIDQTFTDSLFLMGSDGDDGWIWTGDYASTVTKAPMVMYQSGFVSNLEQNYTEYYCDEALAERAGVAHHQRNLMGGEFVFEDGSKVYYGLGPF
jgi:hypothetical protein